jgi:PAS domain S-box-containing protein
MRSDKMASDKLSQKISDLYNQLEDLMAKSISDPGNVAKILFDNLGELKVGLEELTTAEEKLCQQNEVLIAAAEENERLLTADQVDRDRLSALVNSISDEVWFADKQKNFTLANPSAIREFGLGSDRDINVEKLAASLEVYRPDGSPRPVEEAPPLRALNGEVLRNLEEIVRTPNSRELRYRQVSAAPVRDASDNIIGSISIVHDITDYKRMEEELAHLASFPQLNPNPIVEVDPEGCLHYLNNAAEKLFPDLQEKRLNHPWLADWKQISQMFWKNKPQTYDRDILIGEKWYQQLIYSIPESKRIRIYGIDITNRKKMEEALLESEQRFAATLASIGDAVIATDATGKITFMNAVAEDLTGWTFQEASMIPAKEVFNIINEYTRQKVEDPVAKVLDKGMIVGLANHTILVRRDGTEVAVDDSGAPIKDSNGNISGVVLVFRDITERKRAEELLQEAKEELEISAEELRQQNDELLRTQSALQKSEEHARARSDELEIVLDSLPAGIWIAHDPQALHITGNKLSYEWLHIPPGANASKSAPEEERTETFRMFKDGKELLPENMPVQQSAMGKEIRDYEFTFVYPDGTERYVLGNAVPLLNDNGKPRGSVSSFIDITKRKQIEAALRESEQLYRAIGESIDYGVWVCAPDGRNIYASESFLKLVGITQEQCSNFGWGDTLHPDDIERTIAAWKDCVRTGVTWDIEHRFLGVDGKWHDILARGVPVRNEHGEVTCWAGINLDISHIKLVEGELRKARDELEQKVQDRTADLSEAKEELEIANKQLQMELVAHRKLEADLIKAKDAAEDAAETRTSFMANMSHELRTPMNAVIGFTSLLLDENLSSEHKEFVEGIRDGGEAMMALINDILDFSRADKEIIKLEQSPFSLRRCVEESLDLVAVEADKKGLNLSCIIRRGTPDTIMGDHDKLRQILINLLSNAVKFTDEGDVSVSVSSKTIKGNRRQILFAVKDTGIGIPQDKMCRIFEPFTQLERVISRKRDGVGLGLAISKKLVEIMGGEIWVESVPGQGTIFYFTIQAEIVQDEHLDQEEKSEDATVQCLSELKPLSILVAEDNPSNQKVIVTMLKRLGYRADVVADGKEVLQALGLRAYDLILMDVRMPEMDGITATQIIRTLQPKKGPKIVAITAYALEGDREKCLEAGMDDYISKPLKMEKLVEVLKGCSHRDGR